MKVDERGWKWMKEDEIGWKWIKVDESEWKSMNVDERWCCIIDADHFLCLGCWSFVCSQPSNIVSTFGALYFPSRRDNCPSHPSLRQLIGLNFRQNSLATWNKPKQKRTQRRTETIWNLNREWPRLNRLCETDRDWQRLTVTMQLAL